MVAFSSSDILAKEPSRSSLKSPGMRPESSKIISLMAMAPHTSATPIHRSSCAMAPDCTAASWAATEDTWCTSPGSFRPRSVAMKPTVASMHTRPCLTSASRSQRMSKVLEKPIGSKPASPTMVPSRPSGCSMNGRERDMVGPAGTGSGSGTASASSASAATASAAGAGSSVAMRTTPIARFFMSGVVKPCAWLASSAMAKMATGRIMVDT
mmetsp:Transcript_42838/g.134382  ORF Transcript_42838/g.134382 Transcript_42838/m.134382 type:complete len:211 (+) Transcript_42838:985-1617(+)